MKKYTSYIIIASILLLFWEILLIFQGLDFADTGFHLTGFHFIFSNPYSVQYSMSYWLSTVFGHLWMQLYPEGGLLWARIGWIVAINISIIIYFYLIKPLLGIPNTIVGLGVTAIFILQGGPECLNYDIFSTLGYALVILFLYKALTKNKTYLIYISAVLLGVTMFLKLTNISGILFLLVIPFWYYISHYKLNTVIWVSLLYLQFVFIGISSIVLLIYKIGHLDLFLNNFALLTNLAGDSNASHGLIGLLLSYISGYFNAFVAILSLGVIIVIYNLLHNKYTQFFSKTLAYFYYVALAIFVVFMMNKFQLVFWSKIRYIFIGLMLLYAIAKITDNKVSRNDRLLFFVGLIALIVAPIGSDSGMEKSIFGMWILGSFVLTDLDFNRYFSAFKIKFSDNQQRFLQNIILTLVLSSAIMYAWQTTYYDYGSRFDKTCQVNHIKLRHIYTSAKKAQTTNELIHNAFPQITGDESLLMFIEMPMVNYISNKKPFMSYSWPALYRNSDVFKKQLYEALEQRKHLPAIIRQKQNAKNNDWPERRASPNFLSYPDSLSKYAEHGRILNNFIQKYKYKVKWENNMFQLLKSEQDSL